MDRLRVGARSAGRKAEHRADASTDAPKLHETLRDLVRVFEGLADNAQAFMAGVARSLELQRADETAVLAYKQRLIDYLDRFLGDLVLKSEPIAQQIAAANPRIDAALLLVAEREARDAAPVQARFRRIDANAFTASI